jgi:hypothetical protein
MISESAKFRTSLQVGRRMDGRLDSLPAKNSGPSRSMKVRCRHCVTLPMAGEEPGTPMARSCLHRISMIGSTWCPILEDHLGQ